MGTVLTAGELRKGVKLEIDGDPYLIVDFEFTKPGKGQSLYRCRLKNMISAHSSTAHTGRATNSTPPISKNRKCNISTMTANTIIS